MRRSLNDRLTDAARKGKADLCLSLIRRGADVRLQDEDGWTLLHSVAGAGHPAVCALLVDHGADVDAKERDGLTPSHLA